MRDPSTVKIGAHYCISMSGINCKCDNSVKWYVFYQGTFKYEQDVSAVHAAQGAERSTSSKRQR